MVKITRKFVTDSIPTCKNRLHIDQFEKLYMRPHIRTLLFVPLLGLCMTALVACSSSSDDPAGADPGNTAGGTLGSDAGAGETGTETGDPDTGQGGGESGGTGTASGADSMRPPQYLVGECGSLPVSEVAFSTAMSQPASLSVGEVVRGRVIPGGGDTALNYWSIDLQPGFYHLVADVANANGDSLVGLMVTEIGPSGETVERIQRTSEADFRARAYEFLQVPAAKTLTFKIEALFDKTADYTLGLFLNGSAIPGPYFEGCPSINTLSLDTTESLVVNEDTGPDEIAWYRLDVAAGPYSVETSGTRVDDSIIAYSVDVWEQFGQTDANRRVVSNSSTDDVTVENADMEIDGPVWLTVRGRSGSTGVELTVRPQ